MLTQSQGEQELLPSGHCSLESLHRVHSDMQQVLCHLTHPRFTFTESEADADILYHFSHFKDYRWVPGSPQGLIPSVSDYLPLSPGPQAFLCTPHTRLGDTELTSAMPIPASTHRTLSQERPQVLLNQFPCENLLTVKDCLASIARRAGGPEGPPWLPRTFNLRTELPQFVSYFQHRERR